MSLFVMSLLCGLHSHGVHMTVTQLQVLKDRGVFVCWPFPAVSVCLVPDWWESSGADPHFGMTQTIHV
jgi:hypothetical protein